MASRPWTTTPRNYEDFDPFSNLKQEERQDTLVVFLPGYVKEQIRVQMDDRINTLKISGERLIGDNKWRRFRKDLGVPENCNTNDIRAKFENGLLHIIMPKAIKEGSQVQPTPIETKPVLAPQPLPGQNQKPTPFPQTPASRKPELTPPSNLPPKTAPAPQPPMSQNLVTESKPTPSEKPKVTPIPLPPPPPSEKPKVAPITSPTSPSQKPVTRPSPPTRSQPRRQPQPPSIEKPKVTPIPPPQSSPKPAPERVPTPASQLQQIEKPKVTMPQPKPMPPPPPQPQQDEKVKTTPTLQLPTSQKLVTELIPKLPKPAAELLHSEKPEKPPTTSSPPGKKPVTESKPVTTPQSPQGRLHIGTPTLPHPFREKPTTESEPKPTLMSQLKGKFKSDGTEHHEDGKEIDLKAKMSAHGENADHHISKGKKVIDRSRDGENEEERHKKGTEGLAMDSAESRQLLINMGVSLLVIVALGVSVNYTVNPSWRN